MEKRKLRGVTVGVNRKVSRVAETRPHNQPQAARRSASGNTATTWPDHLTVKTDPPIPVHNPKFHGQVLAP
jgi:hypothetical protein